MPRSTPFIAAAFAALLLGAEPGLARDIYVSNTTGDDGSDGRQATSAGRSGPLRTIGRALAICHKGDRIILEDTGEPYRECVSLAGPRHRGGYVGPLTIEGNGAVLDGTRAITEREWRHVRDDVYRYRPPRATSTLLYLDDKPAIRGGREADGSLRLEPHEWNLDRGYVYFRTNKLEVPGDLALRVTSEQVGLTLYHVRDVRIRNLVVQGFALDGINLSDGTADVEISGCILRGNGRSGITAAGSSRVIVDDCLIGDNGVAQVRIEGHSITDLRRTVIVDNTAPAVSRDGGTLLVDGERPSP